MTDTKLGKNLYWMYAVYLGAIPMLFLVGISKLLEKYQIAYFKLNGNITMLLWAICTILTGLLIRNPYDRLMFSKYRWEYDGQVLENILKTISIKNSDIKNIYKGIKRKENNNQFVSFFIRSKIVEAMYDNGIVIETINNEYLLLHFELLENAKTIANEIIQNNKDKIYKEKFDLIANQGIKLNWFKIQRKK